MIVTSYGKSKKTYRVDKIDFDRNPESKFTMKDESEISFAEYFQKQYNITIRDFNQPLIVTKNEKTGIEIALIPEICEMTGLTD